ncbi:MAG: transposase, partial [Candidatus Bipolaricaulia bacterium]
FVGDRGLVSQANLDYLESRRLPYLLGCKLRENDVVQEGVLSLRGRYRPVGEGLGVKETTVTEGGRTVRYLLCRNENRAAHDAEVRRAIIERLEAKLLGSRSPKEHTRQSCKLLSRPGYARFLRELPGGGLRIDREAIRREAKLDGKWVLMTNELELAAEELVLGYRRLWQAERAFRSMKSVLEIEPVYHRLPERIVAHVHLCVLAYLLMRVMENRTQESWGRARERLERISLSRIEGGQAAVLETKRLSLSEQDFLKKCGVVPPPRIVELL